MKSNSPVTEQKRPLSSRTALVTGASRGIGRAIACELGRAGAHVLLNARNADGLNQTAELFRSDGISAEVVPFDNTDEPAARDALDGRDISILVVNAGINVRKPLESLSTDEFRTILECNLVSGFQLARDVSRTMTKNGWGRIVFISSIMGRIARPTLSAYVASKGGVDALVRSLAVELAPHGVTVNGVAPGFVATERNRELFNETSFREAIHRRTPMGRYGTEAEIAHAVRFLCSEEASFMTGQVLAVDGGLTVAL